MQRGLEKTHIKPVAGNLGKQKTQWKTTESTKWIIYLSTVLKSILGALN
jgi:hypothetical protein